MLKNKKTRNILSKIENLELKSNPSMNSPSRKSEKREGNRAIRFEGIPKGKMSKAQQHTAKLKD